MNFYTLHVIVHSPSSSASSWNLAFVSSLVKMLETLLLDHNFSILNHFMNEVVVHVNVLCVCMKFVIFCKCNHTLIITI